MAKYTDEEIRNMKKITCKIAGDYLGIAPMAVSIGMRNDLLPIGFAIHNEDRYTDSWSYNIIAERLIAYNHGKINEIQVQDIEKNLNTVGRTLALTNLAEDYNTACKIRHYISVVEASGTPDEKTAEWIEWAKAKADWYDPTVAKDDEFFGKREHEKDAEKKELQYKGYWW